MTTATEYRYSPINRDQISAIDLNAEMDTLDAQAVAYECAVAAIDNKAEGAQIVFVPSVARAGIAWGADAQWTDATSIEDALDRYINDEMVK